MYEVFKQTYFDYLMQCTGAMSGKYISLIIKLSKTEFTVCDTVPMDINRVKDGMALRKRFLEAKGSWLNEDDAADFMSKPVSVLEMLVALANRIDDQIMYDVRKGNQTARWFWVIMEQTSLDKYPDTNWNSSKVDEILTRLLTRKYENAGKDGWFCCNTCNTFKEIWYQMETYFSEKNM